MFIFTSECVAFMSLGGVWGKKALSRFLWTFFFVKSLTSGKIKLKKKTLYRGLKSCECRSRVEVVFELEVSGLPWEMAFFFGRSFYSWFFLDVSTFDSFVFIMYSVGVNEPPGPPNIARCIPLKGHGEGLLNVRQDFLRIIWKKAKIHT